MQNNKIMKLSIIVPLRNEEANIPTLLLSLIHTLDRYYREDYELIAVTDKSTDNTESFIDTYLPLYPQLKVINRPVPEGFGEAIKTGLRVSTGQILIIFMGDLSDDPETIPRMVHYIDQGYDMAWGSRLVKHGSVVNYPTTKRICGTVFNKTVKTLFGLPYLDYTNAFKAYSREVIDTINLESSGFEITIELPLKAHMAGFTAIEVPTTWTNRTNGRTNLNLSSSATKYGIRMLELFCSGLILSLKDMTKIITTSKTKLIIAALLSVVLIVGLLKLIPDVNIISTLKSANPFYILLSFIICLTTLTLRSYRWQILLKISGKNAPFGIVHKNLVFGFFMNYLIPARAGDIIRTLTLKATTGIPAGISLTTIVIERIIDMTIITLLLVLSLSMIPASAMTTTIFITSLFIVVILITLLCVVYALNSKLASRFPKHESFIQSTKSTIQSMFTPMLAVPFLISIPLWIIEFSTIFLISKSIGLEIPYFVTTTAGITSALAQTVPVTIGSIGVYESIMTGFLSLFGVPASTGFTISVIDHSIRIIILVVLGIIATVHIAFLSRNYFRKNKCN